MAKYLLKNFDDTVPSVFGLVNEWLLSLLDGADLTELNIFIFREEGLYWQGKSKPKQMGSVLLL